MQMCVFHLKSPHAGMHARLLGEDRLRNRLTTLVNVCLLSEQLMFHPKTVKSHRETEVWLLMKTINQNIKTLKILTDTF